MVKDNLKMWRFNRRIVTTVGIGILLICGNFLIMNVVFKKDLDKLQLSNHDTGSGIKRQPSGYYEGSSTNNDEDEDSNDSVRDIMRGRWTFNATAAREARKDIDQYFNPYKVITMTSDDVAHGQLARFYQSKSRTLVTIPAGLHRLLPTKQLFRDERFRKCSIVGNSGILLNSSCGSKIDSSNFIIRCNFATVGGYEKDVGVKTNMITFNPSIVDTKFNGLSRKPDRDKFQRKLQGYGEYVLWVPIFTQDYVTRTIRTLIDYLSKYSQTFKNVQLAFPGNILPDISEFWYSKGVDEDRISTGLLMYNVASVLCDEIHLFGFYPFSDFEGLPIAYHYDDPPSNITRQQFERRYRRFHRLPEEFVYLKKLHKKGAIKLHIGKC